ncbi:hypothetical protein CHCC14819_3609 [Bacillus licheniformis]|nr:hypothetical protein CHCC15320_0686 [Bacillus licheniformis]TWM34583.1 hypothetical protein CHCC14819_3609 [Bacillus licheniformis]TWM46962.1 hypothetical protein CHCC14818_2008 [Bacillus licheniformis]TWN37752.1 hypothetical protein CHCC14525_0985 [Bacillus licheniformis]
MVVLIWKFRMDYTIIHIWSFLLHKLFVRFYEEKSTRGVDKMGFKRSFKIMPGVKLNINKKSVGMTLGGKNGRITYNTSGKVTTSAKIPGTGLSYSSSKSISSSQKQSHLNNNNYSNNLELNAYLNHFTSFHTRLTSRQINWEEIKKESPPEINVAQLKSDLNNYKPNFFERILRLDKTKIEKLNKEITDAETKYKKEYDEWVKQQKFVKIIDDKNSVAYSEILEDIIKIEDTIGKIKEIISNENSEVLLNLLVDTSILPNQEEYISSAGNLLTKKLTKTKYYQNQLNFIASLSIGLAKVIFQIIPVETVSINVLEKRIDTVDGHEKTMTIFGVKFKKEQFMALNINYIKPIDTLQLFETSLDFKKTKGLQPVEGIHL